MLLLDSYCSKFIVSWADAACKLFSTYHMFNSSHIIYEHIKRLRRAFIVHEKGHM